mgnify:CR=1 FL=1
MSSSAPRPLAEGSRWSSLTRWLPAALCFFVTLVAVGPLFADGGFLITRGIGDSPNLLFRVHQWLAAFTSGQFPPRWMPDAAYGYGLPYFTYYASFSTQVAALLKLYGFSYVLAIKLAQALALLTGAVGLYGWLRGSGADQPAAGLAAAAYTFAPFHLVNVYIRGDSLAELWAMGLFPVLLWAAQRVLAQPAPGRAFALAAAVATLVCTHNISALNFLPFLGIYVILGGAGRGWRPLGVSLAALAWGLALSAFFWLPALREGGFVQLGDLTQGYFFYGNHFRDADLLQATPLFDYTSTPFSLGLAQTLAAAAGALALLVRAWRRRRWAWSDLFLLGGLAVATLMITPWSRPVWEAVPLLGYTQFPWRFLSIQAVFTAALTGALVDGEGTPRPGWHWPAALALAALLALAGLGGLRLQFVPLADTEVTAERLNLYEYFTTAVGNTVNAEYLPAAVVPRPFTSETLLGRPPGLKALTGTAEGERLSRAGARETWRVSVAGDQPAAVAGAVAAPVEEPIEIDAALQMLSADADNLIESEHNEDACGSPEAIADAPEQPVLADIAVGDTIAGDAVADGQAAVEASVADAGDEPSPLDVDPMLMEILSSEVDAHLAIIRAYLGETDANGPLPVTEELLRAVHTLNGALSMVDLPALTRVVAPLEGYLKRLRARTLEPSDEGLAALHEASGCIAAVMVALETHSEPPDTGPLAERVLALRDGLPAPDHPFHGFEIHVADEARDESAADLSEVDVNAESASEPAVEGRPWYEAEDDTAPTVELTEVFDAGSEIEPEGVGHGMHAEQLDSLFDDLDVTDSESSRIDVAETPAVVDTEDAASPAIEPWLDATVGEASVDTGEASAAPEAQDWFDAVGDDLAVFAEESAALVSPVPSGDEATQAAVDAAMEPSEQEDAREVDLAGLWSVEAETDTQGDLAASADTEFDRLFETVESAEPLVAVDADNVVLGVEATEDARPEAADESAAEAPELWDVSGETQTTADDRPVLDASVLLAIDEMSVSPDLLAPENRDDLDAEVDVDFESDSQRLTDTRVEIDFEQEAQADSAQIGSVDADAAQTDADRVEEGAESDAEADLGDAAEAESRPESQVELAGEAEHGIAFEPEIDAEPEIEAELEIEPELDIEPALEIEAESEIEAEPEVEAELEFETAPAVDDQSDVEAADSGDSDSESEEPIADVDYPLAEEGIDDVAAGTAGMSKRAAKKAAKRAARIAALKAADQASADAASATPAPAPDQPSEINALVATAGAPSPGRAADSEPAQLGPVDVDPSGPLDLPDIDLELLDIFVEEAVDILDHADGMMARLREAPGDREPVSSLQRDLHTLKGGARMAGLFPIGDLSHAMESLFEAIVHGERAASRPAIEALERAFDRLHGMVQRVRGRQAIGLPEHTIARLEAILEGREDEYLAAHAEGLGNVAAAADAATEAGPAASEADAAPQTTAEDAPDADAAPLRKVIPARPSSRTGVQRRTQLDDDEVAARAAQQELIRVRADLLDNLVNFAGEVSIYRSRLEAQMGGFRFNLVEFEQTVLRLREQLRKLEMETEAQILSRFQRESEQSGNTEFDPLELDRFSTLQQLSRALAESVSDLVSIQNLLDDIARQSETLLLQQSRVSSDLQEGLMRTRMVPFESLVPRLRRILRQTAGELGKRAQLKVEGTQGEMDRTVLERMTAPFEHMLRNSLAHGIESPEVRVAKGKPEEGTVSIRVSREATEVLIQVTDDGAGMNRDAIRRKAVERGLMTPEVQLSDRDIFQFVLEAGFSTASEVSKVAGRGVGMDVVASEVKQLGGSLELDSDPGLGTRITIRLPFTLAVSQAVMVRLGEGTYAIPMSSITGVTRMPRKELERRLEQKQLEVVYGGEVYQIYDLGELLRSPVSHGIDETQVPLLMSKTGDQRAAVRVTQVVGSKEVVVKSAGLQLSIVPGIFGATIMGDGRVVVILDLAPLVRHGVALRQAPELAAELELLEPLPEPAARRQPLVMVVDDSITMRKVTTRVLERSNFDVFTAKDGLDAVEQLQDRMPDVILLDIEMPRMDGYEVATYIRNDQRLKHIPIIMITSRTGEKHRQRAMEVGVDRYLGKPYQETDLLKNVQDALIAGHANVH